MTPPLKFTPKDYKRAAREWGCNCGPVAFAAVVGVSLDAARRYFPDFKGFLTDDMVTDALNSAGKWWRNIGTKRPALNRFGLVTLARHEGAHHLVAAWNDGSTIWILDNFSLRWLPAPAWEKEVLPRMTPGARWRDSVIEVMR